MAFLHAAQRANCGGLLLPASAGQLSWTLLDLRFGASWSFLPVVCLGHGDAFATLTDMGLGLGRSCGSHESVYGMRAWDANGVLMDADYSVVPDGDLLALIMESRGGGGDTTAGIAGRNSDYNEALEVLLQRLRHFGATIRDAWVDSRRTQALGVPPGDRQIVSEPVRLADVADLSALRFEMGRRQERVAQDDGATKGGNRTKRIRLLVEVPGFGPGDADKLADALAVPVTNLVAPRALIERLNTIDAHQPTDRDYAAVISGMVGDLDRVANVAQRVEQSYLRRLLFTALDAACDLCGRAFNTEFLVAAHIKKRAACSEAERRDVPSVVMSACRFGCDELYERGYVSVDPEGTVILSSAVQASGHAGQYARQYLAGKLFVGSMAGREQYFAWHRTNTFRGESA